MRYLEDQLSAEGVAQFRQELATDARKREIFALVCISDTLAHEELPAIIAANPLIDEYPESPQAEESLHDTMVLPAIGRDVEEPTDAVAPVAAGMNWSAASKPKRRWIKPAGWAALLLLGITIFLLLRPRHKAPTIAELASEIDAVWTDPSAGHVAGERLDAGAELDLKSGCATVVFPDSTRLIAQGPVRVKLTGPDAVELPQGKISVKMVEGRSGFVVVTCDSRITDLGTEFGVDADAVTHSTDVHVFSGSVQVAATGSNAPARKVVGGAMAHVSSGVIDVVADASQPQMFVRDVALPTTSLEIADLLSRGDGTTERRGAVIDPMTGACGSWGKLDPWYRANVPAQAPKSDESYHRTNALPVVDGCFVPSGSGAAQQVDSAGDRFQCPPCEGICTMRICIGGSMAPEPSGGTIVPRLGETNYSFAGHSYVLLCPDAGLTLDLSAVRRIHPAGQLKRFRCVFGKTGSSHGSVGKFDLIVLVDGVERFARLGFTDQDGVMNVDLPLGGGDRFLTVITTHNDGASGDDLFIGDAYLDEVPKD